MIQWRDLFGELSEPWLVMVCGLVGVGKTTIAREIACSLRARYLNTDKIGYRLFGENRAYDDEYYRRVYEVMTVRARQALCKRRHVVLDGTFLRRATRQRFFTEFRELASPWIVYVTCSGEAIQARLEGRQCDSLIQRGYSEGQYKIYQYMKEEIGLSLSDPRTDLIPFITVDTSAGEPRIIEVSRSYQLTLRSDPGGW